jgi:UDP-N-acetylmuramoylalanine--D-glutamate ligase
VAGNEGDGSVLAGIVILRVRRLGNRTMSEMFNFDSRETVLVIGLGKSGLASTEVLRSRGVTVFATDEKPRSELGVAIAAIEGFGATFVAPDELDSLWARLNSAVLSPGVPPTSPVVQAVNRANVPVVGEIEVAYRLCGAPIVAVTGTKGKSTTTALIGHLLRGCGRNVRVGGNIGNPLIKEVLGTSEDDWVVAEVSSFQLETIRSFRPRVAVLLNLAPDHLDRYYSMDEYAEAKYRIFANLSMSDWFVGNLDDPRIAALHWRHEETRVQARQLWFTLGARHPSTSLRAGSATMYLQHGMLTYAPIVGDPRPVPVVPREEIPLAGDHNVQNAMAALLAALAVGCEPEALRTAIASFRPMAHRLEPVAEIDGVLYVDDSKSTNPGSVIAALHSYDRPIVLIAGGRAKGTSFDDMGAAIRERAKALIVIGEAGDEIGRVSHPRLVVRASSMDDAVRRARDVAEPGDVVLLSPGCASFDMFTSAEDRGEKFSAAVGALREPAGA